MHTNSTILVQQKKNYSVRVINSDSDYLRNLTEACTYSPNSQLSPFKSKAQTIVENDIRVRKQLQALDEIKRLQFDALDLLTRLESQEEDFTRPNDEELIKRMRMQAEKIENQKIKIKARCPNCLIY